MASVGWDLLEHNKAAGCTTVLKDAHSYPFHPLAPGTEKLTAVEGDPWSQLITFILEGPERKHTYHGAKALAALLWAPHYSPSSHPAQPQQQYVW